MDFFDLGSKTIAFMVVCWLYLWVFDLKLVKKRKYAFRCPICTFRVSADDKEVLTRALISHHHNRIVKDS